MSKLVLVQVSGGITKIIMGQVFAEIRDFSNDKLKQTRAESDESAHLARFHSAPFIEVNRLTSEACRLTRERDAMAAALLSIQRKIESCKDDADCVRFADFICGVTLAKVQS